MYVAEDGGDMQIVLVRSDGRTYRSCNSTGVTGSEITGPAFDPSGTRLYFSSQRESRSDVRGQRPVGDLRRRDRLSSEVANALRHN